MSIRPVLTFLLAATARTAWAQPAPPTAPPAPEPPPEVTPPPAAGAPVVDTAMLPPPPAAAEEEKKPEVTSKWDLTLYGFVEFDSIWDSTQGLGDGAGNSVIARPNTYAGDHDQLMFGGRNSRIGIKLAAPVHDDIKASAQLEMDFLGNQPPGISEASFWQNPTFRFRHLNLKLQTKPFDILIGQSWQLFGWQTLAHPNTVDIQGMPGQVYSRVPQIRISKVIEAGSVNVEVAIAAERPPQRASSTPDGHVGVKLVLPKLKAWRTGGSTGSSLDSAALGVSAVGRRFAVDEFAARPSSQVVRKGYGVSIDALVPIVAATKDHKANATTLTASYVYGAGIGDLYTGLSGGTGNPALPNPTMASPAPTYTSNVDNGLVLFASDGTLHPIQWTSYMAGLQYYLPPAGKAWLAANFSHLSSDNAHLFGATSKVFDEELWLNGDVFCDLTPAVRLGLGIDWTKQTFVDKVEATDVRVQGSAFFIF
jgi:hypothetical protein